MSYLKTASQALLGGLLIDAIIYVAVWIWDYKRQVTNLDNTSTPDDVALQKRVPKNGIDANEVYYRALFFPESKIPCHYYYQRKNGCTRTNCPYSHKAALLEHLLHYLNKADKTLDICVYLITCTELCSAILEVNNRGVRIRIITDGTNSDEANAEIGKLRAEGIAIRANYSAFLMHHKFVIVDQCILINGSFNWTWKAITGNHENVCATNNPALVQPYLDEFKHLWEKFNPQTSKS